MDLTASGWIPELIRGVVASLVFGVGCLLAGRRWKGGDDRVDADNGVD